MKKIILAVILTLLANILCLPLWTEYDYGGFVRTLFNKEARVDFLYQGRLTGTESCPAPVTCSHVYERENSRRAVLVLMAREKWQKLSLQLRALQDGKITMIFRGPEERDELGEPYSVLTDWENLKINGKVIFNETKTLSLVKCFSNQIHVKKGEVFRIETEFRRHPFSIHDFKLLESRNFWFLISGNLLFFFFLYRLLDRMAIQGGVPRRVMTFY